MFRQPKKHAASTSSKGNDAPPTPQPPRFYFQAESAGAKVYMTSTMNTPPSLLYSTDGGVNYVTWNFTGSAGNWTAVDLTFPNIGDRIYIQGENEKLADMDNLKFSTFKVRTGYVSAGGSVQTLAKGKYGDDGEAVCMARLFYYCDRLKAAPLLTATKVHDNDYWQMFTHCTGLVSLPDDFRLPAMDLGYGCYAEMFAKCTALASLPEGFALPAATLAPYCYNYMFSECTFDMSDDGTTFNFPVGATLPQTVGDDTFTTPAELAAWMGNTTGFIE